MNTRLPELYRRERGHAFYPPKRVMARIPAFRDLYDVDNRDVIMHIHYFATWGDWWIAELDPESGEAYGWGMLNGDVQNGEWGYPDLPALESAAAWPKLVERDLWFEPQPARDCLPCYRKEGA